MIDNIPNEVREAGPGIVGSAIAFLMSRRVLAVRAGMFFGGCVLAWVAPKPIVKYFSMSPESIGLIAFVAGVLGMSAIAKVMDSIEGIDAKQLASDLLKKIGIGGS